MLHLIWIAFLWQKAGLNIIYIPLCDGYKFHVVVRYDLSSWVEVKLLRTFFSRVVADFLWKDVTCCHGCYGKLVIDGKSENKDGIAELVEKYRVKKVMVSAYHP